MKRNRIKRLVREFFRHYKDRLPHDVDIVIAAKKGAADLDFRKTREELGAILLDQERHT